MIFNNLTPEQIRAVREEGHVLLSACPGSGKTKTIIHKLAYEVSQLDDTSKKKAIAVTFTVRASEEIFKRLERMGIDSKKVWSGTLHSFCLEWIIKPYSCYLTDLQNGYIIADESFTSSLLNDLKGIHQLNSFDNINTRFERDGSFAESGALKIRLLTDYHTELKRQKLIDFDILLYYSFKLLKDYPEISKVLSKLLHLICVDEYQDTQDLSYAILCSIVNASDGATSLFLAGDVDQAIYHSFGGVAKSKKEIETELNGEEVKNLPLTGNFRSTQRIIDFYHSFQSIGIPIIATGVKANVQGVITYNNTIHKDNLVTEVARLIQDNIDKNIPENEICILVPQWWLITIIARQLQTILPNINFDASGIVPMSKNKDNFWYKLSRLFLTEPSPNIYALRYQWARELMDKYYEHTGNIFVEPHNSERNILRLVNSISSYETEAIPYLHECFDKFLVELGLNINNFKTIEESRNVYFENINRRFADTNYDVPSDIVSFKNLYKERRGVVINTCVGIKGEEFETVIAFGLLRGYIPHWNEIMSRSVNELEVSRKLLYVICSRAKQNLHLISESGRTTRRGVELENTPLLINKNYNYD